jgi:hypothetical protein
MDLKKYTKEELEQINAQYRHILFMNIEQTMEELKNCQGEQKLDISLIKQDMGYVKEKVSAIEGMFGTLSDKLDGHTVKFTTKEEHQNLVNKLWGLGVGVALALIGALFSLISSLSKGA